MSDGLAFCMVGAVEVVALMVWVFIWRKREVEKVRRDPDEDVFDGNDNDEYDGGVY